jgi:hypothetical protein
LNRVGKVKRRSHSGVVATALALAALGCTKTDDPQPGRDVVNQTAEVTWCIGRFRFAIDSALEVAGRSQRIYRVNVSTLPNGDGNGQQLWQARLAAIRATNPVAPEVRVIELEPGVPGAWYRADPNDRSFITLEAMKFYPDHALYLAREVASGSEAVTEKMYRRVIAGYAPHAWRGFCVGDGALNTETSKNEQTLIRFTDPMRPSFELSLATHTVDRPETSTLHDLEIERRILMESGAIVTILRNEARVVAQLPGIDARIQVQPPGGPATVRFSWRFDGSSGNALAPQIIIIASAALRDAPELNILWEKFLASLQPLSPPTPAP